MTNFFLRPRRREWFVDYDDILTTTKREDEVRTYTIDWTEELAGETISTATWTEDGVTINSSSNTNTTTTVTVTDSGAAEVSIVTSGGRTIEKKFRWRATDGTVGDYD